MNPKSDKAQAGATIGTIVILIIIGAIIYFVFFYSWTSSSIDLNSPQNAAVGENFNVAWQITGSGTINSTYVLIYNTTTNNVNPTGYISKSSEFCTSNCSVPMNFTDSLSLNKQGIYYIRAYANVDNQSIWSNENKINISTMGNQGNTTTTGSINITVGNITNMTNNSI